MSKTDLKKALTACYTARKEVAIIDVPAISYISYEGRGDPRTSQDFIDSMGVIYGLAYTLKFICKESGDDFSVMPLEAQWWSDDPARFGDTPRDEWRWKAMIAVPGSVDATAFERARAKLREKKDPPGLERAILEVLTDGVSAQFLYTGPYAGEAPHIAAMHRQVAEMGYLLRGRHREIYLNSPQRVAEEKLKTIIRQPIEKR